MGEGGTNRGAVLGSGALRDAAGHDWYADAWVRCGDCALVPKGTGAQLDV